MRVFAVVMVALLMYSCAHRSDATSPVIVKRSQMLMGTLVFVTSVAEDEIAAQRAVQAAFAEIRRLEELLSTWISTSELSIVNSAAGHGEVRIGPEAMYVLTRSLQIAQLTEGGFNIAIGPAVRMWNVT